MFYIFHIKLKKSKKDINSLKIVFFYFLDLNLIINESYKYRNACWNNSAAQDLRV